MATTTIPWGDGSGDNLYFTADAMEGNQEVLVSSDANAGEQRSKTVTFSAQGAEPKSLGVIQLGSGGPTPDFDDWVKDGDTHLWINILTDFQKAQDVRIKMVGTIDWGDGTSKQNVSATSVTTFSHTYTDKGKYRIDLHPTSGTMELGSSNTNYSVMGDMRNAGIGRSAALYQAEVGSSIINTVNAHAFKNCKGLKRVFVPDEITTLGSDAFSSCSGLQQVIFEDSSKLTSVTWTNLFYYCYGLVDISTLVASAGTSLNQTCRSCSCLDQFSIPSTVTSIAANTFNGCASMQHLYCYPQSPPSVANANAFSGLNASCVIHVPNGKLNTYKTASIWSTYASQMVEMT